MVPSDSERNLSDLQRPLEQFRAKTKRLKVHPAEIRVVWVVAANLVFLPWALGGVRPWAQWISLGLAVLAFLMALMPRDYTEQHTGTNRFRLVMWPKLLHFPIFWIGAALLGLIAVQALNPAWTYVTNGVGWWMQQAAPTAWLPAGVDVPFEHGGPWRSLLVYASIYLTVCTLWIAITRRRSLLALAIVLASNGVVLALLGIAQRFVWSPKMFWSWTPPPKAVFYSSFIYKNHAGAFLALAFVITSAVTLWYYFRGVRRLEKSNPAGLFGFFGLIIMISLLVSYARGATLATLGFAGVLLVSFVVQQFSAAKDRRRPIILVVLLLVFGTFIGVGYKAFNVDETWRRIDRGLSAGGDYSYRSRQIADRASFDMLKENWRLGVGSGSFRYLFPIYQQNYPDILTFPGTNLRQYWQHAHNDILEFPIELGVPGMLLVALGLGYWGVVLVRHYFWQNALSLVLVFGAVVVATYSWWDFPFQCPAILMWWCCLWPISATWAKFEASGAH